MSVPHPGEVFTPVPSELHSSERHTTILAHAGLVKSMAARHRLRPNYERDDVIQDGFVGLIGAVDDYDPSRGTRLATYAYPRILERMVYGQSAHGYPVRITPGDERHLRHSEDAAVDDVHTSLAYPTRLDAPRSYEHGSPAVSETLADPSNPTEDEIIEAWELPAIIRDALDRLPPTWRGVIQNFYGMSDREPVEMAEAAANNGVALRTGFRLRDRALEALRQDTVLLDYVAHR